MNHQIKKNILFFREAKDQNYILRKKSNIFFSYMFIVLALGQLLDVVFIKYTKGLYFQQQFYVNVFTSDNQTLYFIIYVMA